MDTDLILQIGICELLVLVLAPAVPISLMMLVNSTMERFDEYEKRKEQ